MCGHESSKNIANSKWKKRYHQFGVIRLLPQRNNPTPICKKDIDVSACPDPGSKWSFAHHLKNPFYGELNNGP
jgi:hypothetical protein